MKCSKCNADITEDMLVCPNCKKVLKLVCPKCDTINTSNICKKCGFSIISKCHKCGKINQTIKEKCSKCGFGTYTSVAINSSNIDEFACLTIEFPNISDIKSALGSTKLMGKFRANLDNLILNYTGSAGVKREIIENVYIIRFNKDSSFKESAKNAIKAAIEIQNLITELNSKLLKLNGITLQSNIAILKRDIYSKPEHYKSGFDIKLIYNNKSDFKLINSLQVITDSAIYEQVCDDYDLSSLSTSFVKNEMIMFFELKLKKYIKMPETKQEEENVPDLSKLNIFDEPAAAIDNSEELYEIDAMDFNELKCSFTKVKSIEVIPKISQEFSTNRKKIISVRGNKEFLPETGDLIIPLEQNHLFKNIYRITCHDETKFKPYGFFYQLISQMNNYSQSPVNFEKNNFDIFKEMDPSGFIKDLINLTERQFPHPEDVRYSLFDIFFEIFRSISKSLIYIENFDKIDDTSYEVLQLFFRQFESMDVSYLITTSKDVQVHKESHFLLANPSYIELFVKPSLIKEILEKDIKKYENILDNYYIKKIAQNSKGSVLYFNNGIEYLSEKNILTLRDGKLNIEKFENILIPATLDELINKRLQNLQKDASLYKILGMLILIGPFIDIPAAKLFGADEKVLNILFDKKYIYLYNNAVYIRNYNLLKENFLTATPQEIKQQIAGELLGKIFITSVKHPVQAELYKILNQEKQEFLVWEQLSKVNASIGDFSAYLNCSIKFLKLLDNYVNEGSQKTIEDYKMEVYENIANLLYKYKPNEIHNIAQVILENLEKSTDNKRVIDLCNKMLQGCLIDGNYSHAMGLLHKILSKFSGASINPSDKNFNASFFLISLVKIEIMFSVGNFKECIDAGEEILNVITPENINQLKPTHLSIKQFEDVIIEAMAFAAISKIILLQTNLEQFNAKLKENIGRLPKVFELFFLLEKVIKGEQVEIPKEYTQEDNKFFTLTINILKAFSENLDDYRKFADNIYQAKISAKMNKLSQIELMCDLLIGYAYFQLNQNKKAASIYYNVLETSTKNGLKMVTCLDWYFISMLKFKQEDLEVAFGIANNAIVQLEKESNTGNFLFFLFMILLSKILMAKNEKEFAEICLNNAKFIKEKYGLKFEIGEPS